MPTQRERFSWSHVFRRVRTLLRVPGGPTISPTIILKRKTTTREARSRDNERILHEFRRSISRNELPNDESLSRVLNALGYLYDLTRARKLFDLFDKQGQAGPWSHSAMMGLSHKEEIAYAFEVADKYRRQSYPLDAYVTTQMMMIYRKAKKPLEAIALYDQFTGENDTHLRNEYLQALWEARPEKAIQVWEHLVQQQKAGGSVLDLASWNITIGYWASKKQWNKAVDVFVEATQSGFYANNQLDAKRRRTRIVLDFHFEPTYLSTDDLVPDAKRANGASREGGIPAAVAQVALLHFIKTAEERLDYRDADIITGGHRRGQVVLRDTIPSFLKQQFGTEVKWDRLGLCQLSIPFDQLRRASFIYCLWQLLECYPDSLAALQHALVTSGTDDLPREMYLLISRYRADLRRANVGEITKHFSTKPQVPEMFSPKNAQLAEQGLTAFDEKDIPKARQAFQKLIYTMPNHPWGYLRLGWVFHRLGNENEAIRHYQMAINLLSDENDWHEHCAEGYSYLGWSCDRQYHKTGSASLLESALTYYQQAEQFQACSKQTDYLNRWGIALKTRAELKTTTTTQQRHDLQQAIEKFQQAVAAVPEHSEAHIHRGDCLLAFDQYEEAVVAYQTAFSIKQRAWPQTRLAHAYLRQYHDTANREFLTKGMEAANEAIRLHPKSDRAYLIRSQLQAVQGNWDESNASASKAKRINPAVKTPWLMVLPHQGQSAYGPRGGQLSIAAREAVHRQQHQRTSAYASSHDRPNEPPTSASLGST